ncbi:MAG: SHOCT domain-containing protein [Planctomycetota bacterium]|nr:MAG: SHOCT domain-containing protein [Planctomycetota bacterium]
MTALLLGESATHGAGVIFFRAALLLIALIAAWVGSLWVARWVRRRYAEPQTAEPFTLQDLRDMHAQGQITGAEFEHLRADLIGRMRAGDAEAGDAGEGVSSS